MHEEMTRARRRGGRRGRAMRTWLVGLALVLWVCLLAVPEIEARRFGGRIGGFGGFRASRGFGRSSFGGFRSTRSFSRPGVRRSYYGGTGIMGFGFFPFPIFGFGGGGGGGLFGTIIFLAIAYFVIRAMMRGASRVRETYSDTDVYSGRAVHTRNFTVARLQLALLFTARNVQRELEQYADRRGSETPEQLADLLHETARLLLANQEYWRFASWQVEHPRSIDATEELFTRETSEQRTRYDYETVSSVDGRRSRREAEHVEDEGLGEVGGYIVVTLLVALSAKRFKTINNPTLEDVRRVLAKLGGVIPAQTLGVQIIWVPSDRESHLSEDDLMVKYGNLAALG